MLINLWPWIQRVAVLLEDNERQSVLGDVQERGADLWALFDVTGLVALRQIQTWRSESAWILALALALPAWTLAGGADVMARTVSYFPWPELSGVRLLYFLVILLIRFGATVGLAWVSGFSLVSLIGYRSGSLLIPLALIPLWTISSWSQFVAAVLLIGIPVLFGMVEGWRGETPRPEASAYLYIAFSFFAMHVPGSHDWTTRCLTIIGFWPAYYVLSLPLIRRARA